MAGWLSGRKVTLLEQEMIRWLDEVERLVLDLAGVKSIDEGGLALLRRWSGPRLVLRGGSAYLRAQLAAEGMTVG